MISLRTWERQICHACGLLRSVAVCDGEGQRQDLYNHTRICARSVNQMEHRLMLPDPFDDCTDSEWINANLDFLQVAMNMVASPWCIR